VRGSARGADRISAVRVVVRSPDSEDRGVGIVIARRPLTVLVPSHLIVLLEDGDATSIIVESTEYPRAAILATPSLQSDHLTILRFGRRGSRDLANIRLPKRPFRLTPGQSVSLCGPAGDDPRERPGRVVDVRERGDGTSVLTDIEVTHGESGSAVLVSDRLAGICQGMTADGDAGTAIAVPLSVGSLTELRRIRRRVRIRAYSAALTALLAVAIAFGAFGLHSWRSFRLAGIEVQEDGSYVAAHNERIVTIWRTWHRSFETPIRRAELIPEDASGAAAFVAIGTIPRDEHNGAFVLLDRFGEEVWRYAVPDGECIYSTEEEVFDRYLVDRIYQADLTADGAPELLVVFVHDHFFPCKLVVFDLAGEILAEYWHPGYIRTIGIGQVGEEPTPLVVVSASNNRLKTDWWNPQTVFAFRGLEIAGQAPPYTGTHGSDAALRRGPELWYRVIENIDPELKRAKCYDIDIVDSNGDGAPDIRASLSDGRFYYLDEHGTEQRVDVGDQFLRDFAGIEPPPLTAYPLP